MYRVACSASSMWYLQARLLSSAHADIQTLAASWRRGSPGHHMNQAPTWNNRRDRVRGMIDLTWEGPELPTRGKQNGQDQGFRSNPRPIARTRPENSGSTCGVPPTGEPDLTLWQFPGVTAVLLWPHDPRRDRPSSCSPDHNSLRGTRTRRSGSYRPDSRASRPSRAQ